MIVHLYDLSATDEPHAETRATREFETLRRLQRHAWAPRVLDSYQPAPGYAGEMHFFTLTDPLAPSVEKRTRDSSWDTPARLALARAALGALGEMHGETLDDAPILHRNLTPQTVLVRHDNTPIFTGFELSKLPSEQSVASTGPPTGGWPPSTAPEVRTQGLHAADARSDRYALCASLRVLFEGRDDETSRQALEVLASGTTDEATQRSEPSALDARFSALLGESPPQPAPPPARFWTEDQIVPFRDGEYRVIERLGSGGVGTAFKVVQLDRRGKNEGTYVAKVCHDEATGHRAMSAYRLARSHLQHQAVSGILEVASTWRENEFTALMTWVDGSPLRGYAGVLPLLADDLGKSSAEALALSWLRTMCEALDVLHRNGLVHGDVSPANLIVSGATLVLTDYDFVGRVGEPITAPGAALYCSPSHEAGRSASPSDDLYALAASFFHVIFDCAPFRGNGAPAKERGLNWEAVDAEQRSEYPTVARFLERATEPDADRRFRSATEALTVLVPEPSVSPSPAPSPSVESGTQPGQESKSPWPPVPVRREERVEWLKGLLRSYPGSQWGNRETRGLDSDFAEQTYVETPLEAALYEDVRARRVRLVVLCGNAGDGKTALLQHLAGRFGLKRLASSERVLEGGTDDGLRVRMNLDGSASWQGRSADDLLDEFFAPFRDGPPAEDVAHLLAINDGRLLEWIEQAEQGKRGTALTRALYDVLQRVQQDRWTGVATHEDEEDGNTGGGLVQDPPRHSATDAHIRFVNLNQRSLVGGVTADGARIETGFLERLVDHLYGGSRASEIWAPCTACSAQDRCRVFQANRLFGPDGLPGSAAPETRSRARERLFEALQAVHLRGETHVTVRELRAALVYILFGVHFCDDYHKGAVASGRSVPAYWEPAFGPFPGTDAQEETAPLPQPYWDRAFDPQSPQRQGGVLADLARFDPALDAHPRIDRHLLPKGPGRRRGRAPLASARRRAYFEWLERDIESLTGDRHALELAHGRHLRRFRRLPIDHREREAACQALCKGIARLATLPPVAYKRPGVVPLRITPRTPTETAFWIEKPADRFRLEADLPVAPAGFDRLHRQATLVYAYRDGREERLRLGAELFHLLLELSEGYQMGDASTDDTFAHLSIFVQRLEREDDRRLLAWNPMRDEAVHEITATRDDSDGPQRLVIRPLA